MPTVHDEVETKYEAEAGFEVPSLVELFGAVRGKAGVPASDGAPWAEGELAEQHLDATYYDTAALDLAAAGLTLRRRVGGDDAGWHLKVPVADSSRSEIRVPLQDEQNTVPDQLVTMTYARTGGRTLVAVARIATDRTVRRLVDPTGRVLVEVADDRVTAHRLLPSGDPAEAISWREVEVELVDGPRELLTAVDPVLRERGLTPAPTSSKLVRALGAETVEAARKSAGGTGPATVGGKGRKLPKKVSAGDVAMAHIGAQVSQIRAQDLPVRLDLPGAVHAMRVASRRLRSALTTFEPLFHGTVTRPAGRELRWLAGVLGVARDAEVMRDRLTAAVVGEGDDTRLSAGVDQEVSDRLDESYRAAHDQVLVQLDGERYRVLLATLEALLEHPPFKDRASRPARNALPGLVTRSYAALRWSMVAANGSSDPVEHENLLHDARKAAKRARYAGEAVAPVFGDDARAFAAAMERVQESLGEHLESMNTRNRLHDLAAQTSEPSTAFTLGRLHALEEVRAERSAAEVDAAWAAASKKRLRRWLH